MNKRSVALLWPFWIAPFAALLVVKLSGPTYTDAPNQGAMVLRFLGLIAWFFIASIGTGITLLTIKSKHKIEVTASVCAALASFFVFYAISTRL